MTRTITRETVTRQLTERRETRACDKLCKIAQEQERDLVAC